MSTTTELAALAQRLLSLHQPGNPVVLPTVWDGWSAKVAVGAGFDALTVGSHPVAASVGRADGEDMSFDELTERVTQITRSVDVPISVDIESGYGQDAGTLIDGLLRAGAVGLNIEDTVHGEGGRLRSAEEHAALVGELRAASDRAGVHVVLNARTDAFKQKLGPDDERVDLAIARMVAIAHPVDSDPAMYARAGAGRISFGPLWQLALAKVSEPWLGRWR